MVACPNPVRLWYYGGEEQHTVRLSQGESRFVKQGAKLTSHEWNAHERVIVFDGVCNLCNRFVNFVMDRDSKGLFKFGTLQSEPAQIILKELNLARDDFETFLLLEDGKVYTKSTAAIKILRTLGYLWPLMSVFMIVPQVIRDQLYSFVARNRYRWMGRADVCRVPTPKDLERFV